eukprot:TRINITY_DN143_c0_g1_i1.p1 TRINITY_DN143_c0_g1~~TRINITY_DN143_c0_g1_i1.p1  ORF type:complete len:215 (+),score=21.14 TRINITY_DN143_c0_g1_i1:55-699(+)
MVSSRLLSLFLLSCVLLTVAQNRYNSTNCGANTCASDGDGPVCFDGKCVECNPNGGQNGDCICGGNQYCVSDETDKDYASCRSFDSSILGNACDPGVTANNVVLGLNDKLFCGKLVWNMSFPLYPTLVEWTGFCDGGKCRACSSGNERCSGSGYTCRGGSYIYQPADSNSWTYFGDSTFTLSSFMIWLWFYIFAPIGIILYCIFFRQGGKRWYQ